MLSSAQKDQTRPLPGPTAQGKDSDVGEAGSLPSCTSPLWEPVEPPAGAPGSHTYLCNDFYLGLGLPSQGKGTILHRTALPSDVSGKAGVPGLPHFWLAGYKFRRFPLPPDDGEFTRKTHRT